MRHKTLATLCIVLAITAFTQTRNNAIHPEYDLVIRGARVLDGTGNPWYYADVGVLGERISRIGRISEKGRREIDAAGMYLTPGLIDMHSHSDYTLLVDGNAESKLRQGVTTEILGEASSAAPRCPAAQPEDDAATEPY
ncbi:MAG TPA: amidohydrolase family protein, partial [Terriglobales bacterium]